MRLRREKIQILLVEDNEAYIRMIQETMRDCDHCENLMVAKDGEEALAYLRDESKELPHLILLDLNLPLKTGHEVLVEVKSDPSLQTIPVVVLTSSDAARDRRQTFSIGCNAYLVKPTSYADTLEMVQALEQFWVRWARYANGV